MELNVRLSAKDLQTQGVFDALERLCLCFKPEESKYVNIHPPKQVATAQLAEGSVNSANAPVSPAVVPVSDSAQTVPAARQNTAVVPTVPTASPQSFDLAQVAQAAAVFAETSEQARAQVVELIHAFGVNALTEIPPEQLGAFATRLRGMGAKI